MSVASRLGLAALAAAVLAGAASELRRRALRLVVEAGGVDASRTSVVHPLAAGRRRRCRSSDVTRDRERQRRSPGSRSSRQGTAKGALGGRARDRRVADDEGQADRGALRGRPRVRGGATPNEQIAIVTFNGDVNVLQPLHDRAQRDQLGAREAAEAQVRHEDLRRARAVPGADQERRSPGGIRDHPHRRPERRQRDLGGRRRSGT